MSIKLEHLPSEYRLNHEYIDSQHEVLFNLFQELSEYCNNKEYELEIDLILLSLKTYVDTHFRFEEDLMEKSGYSEVEEHKSMHLVLEQQVIDKIDYFESLSNQEEIEQFTLEMKDFLLNWLIDHIAKTDRKFCRSI
ncbi:MAG: bacteriohemerythrin [Magnetococcales bacterium]|nr:bacteriohemerythrin [Magnetococcales bacterium]